MTYIASELLVNDEPRRLWHGVVGDLVCNCNEEVGAADCTIKLLLVLFFFKFQVLCMHCQYNVSMASIGLVQHGQWERANFGSICVSHR